MASTTDPAPIGDIVRALSRCGGAAGPTVANGILRALGWPTRQLPAGPSDATLPGERPRSETPRERPRDQPPGERQVVRSRLQPIGGQHPKDEPDGADAGPLRLPPREQHRPVFELPIDPLIEPRLARSMLARLCSVRLLRGELDIVRLVRLIAQGQAPTRPPRRPVATLAPGLQLLLDVAPAMQPFHEDTLQLLRELERTVGLDRIEVLEFEACPSFGVLADGWAGDRSAYVPPRAGTPVLAVTDLGLVRADPRERMQRARAWHQFRYRLAANRTPLSILSAYAESRLGARHVTHRLRLVLWDRGTGVRRISPAPLMRGPDD